MNRPLYQHIAFALSALSNCVNAGNEFAGVHEATLEHIAREFLPSGSGIDCGTKIDVDASLRQPGRIILTLSYHHMNDGGMYDGWTEHKAVVSPDLCFGYSIKITGRDRNQIKEHLNDVLCAALDRSYNHNAGGEFVTA